MNKKRNLIIIILFILLILLIPIILITIIKNNNNKLKEKELVITIENGELQPEFNLNTYNYVVYTKNDTIKIICNIDIDDCNQDIDINELESYKIKYNNKYYYFDFIKVEDDIEIPTIKILDVKGNSTNWVRELTLEVQVYNPNNEELSYSFDNGTSWSDSNKKKITTNGIYTILVKSTNIVDQTEVEITKIDNTAPIVSINQKKINNNEITLEATAHDDLSGIDTYTWSTKETTTSIKVTKNGKYTLTVKDKAGNETKNEVNVTTIGTGTNPETTFNAVFDSNDNTGKLTNLSCTTKTGSCTITAPQITRNGYIVLGWSTNPNSKTAEYKVNDKITLNKNSIFYAITYKTITVTFDRNGNTSQTDNNVTTTNIITKKCNIYNKETKCTIKTPKINMNGFTILGYSTGSTTYSDYWKENTDGFVYDNKKYYAQTYKEPRTVSVFFYRNGNESLINSAGKTITDKEYKESCTIPSARNGSNQNDYCSIISPTIIMSGNTILGYSNFSNDTTITWEHNTKKNIKNTGWYYAQTYKKYNATFDKNGSTSVGATALNCISYNNNNGCNITAPTITRKGFTINGWSTNMNASTGEYLVGNIIFLTKNNSKFYAITSKEITVTFNKNGNTNQIDGGNTYTSDTYNKKCTIRNIATSCNITPPTANTNNYEFLGYTTGSTVYSNFWKTGAKSFTQNATYYGQTIKTVTVTFDKNTTFDHNTVPKTSSDYHWSKTNIAATKLSFYNRTCTSRNNVGCYIGKVPIIYSSGNEVVGWSFSSDGGISYIGKLQFKQDTTIYARIYNSHSKGTFNCSNCSNTNPKKIGNMIIEYDNSISGSKQNSYNTYLEHMYAKMPQMFKTTAKIRVVSRESFNDWWGAYGGITGGYYEYPIVDIPEYGENHFRGAIAHELGHALDRYYGVFSSSRKRISQDQTLINMAEKCRTDVNECGYIWEHGTSDSEMNEFVANMFHVYFYNIANTEDLWTPSNPDKMILSTKLRNKIINYLNEVSAFE